MTELKARGVDDVYIEYYNTGKHDLAQVYLKSEADKYIADLKESHKKEVGQLLILNREQANAANRLRDSMEQVIRHQKYKRCMAMAGWCEEVDLFGGCTSIYWIRWRNKWLALAEKFKEAK